MPLLRTVPTKTGIFAQFMTEADLSMGYWNPKRKLGVTMPCLAINKQFLMSNFLEIDFVIKIHAKKS